MSKKETVLPDDYLKSLLSQLARSLTDEKKAELLMMLKEDPDPREILYFLEKHSSFPGDKRASYDDDDLSDYGDDEYFDEEGDDIGTLCDPDKPASIYKLRVSLNNSPIKIERYLSIPSNMRLEHLASIIILTMGWNNTHQHQFIKGDKFYTYPSEDGYDPSGLVDSYYLVVNDVLKTKNDVMQFEYDFGDSWMHDVVLTDIQINPFGNSIATLLLGGRGACPPDDIGGTAGLERLIKALSGESRTKKYWRNLLGYTYRPDDFDLAETQEIVEHYVMVYTKGSNR